MKEIKLEASVLNERARKNLAILDAIRRAGLISKAEISKFLGLNVVTISNYIDELLRHHLVLEKDLDISGGGRRPVLLGLNPEAGLAIGVGVNLFNLTAVSADLSGKIFTHTRTDKKSSSVGDVVNLILETIKKTIEGIAAKDKIKGIGLGIAGIVDKEKDIVRWPQKVGNAYNYATISLPLKNIIEREFNLPCIIENDATAACFGEQWLTLPPDVKNVLFLFSGVGCGIMINGEIYHGSTGCAGEISIYNHAQGGDFNCEAGNPCFLKRWEIDLGMVDEAKNLLKDYARDSKILAKAATVDNITLRDIFDAAKAKDETAVNIVRGAAKRLGIKAAYLVNLFNPQVLIIGGGLEEVSEIMLDVIRRTVSDWAFEETAREVKIIPSSLGDDAAALGAANLVVRQVFSQM